MATIERCASCQGIISTSDESFPWGELVVCRACYGELATEQPEPRLTRPVQFGPLTIGPAVLTVGSVTVPIQNIASVQAFNARESTETPWAVAIFVILGLCGPLVLMCVAVGLGNSVLKHASQATVTTVFVMFGGASLAVFAYSVYRIIRELSGKRAAVFLLVTTTAGQQVRIDFATIPVMNRALAAIRRASGGSGASVTFNTLIVNRPQMR